MRVSGGSWRSSPLKTNTHVFDLTLLAVTLAFFFFFQSPRWVMKERNPRPAATPIQDLRVSARGRQCRGVPAESEHCAGTVSETQIMATERQDNRHPSCCSQAPSTRQEKAIKPQHASLLKQITSDAPPI